MAASPQCEDGFLQLAHELDAALSVAGFGVWESLVLRLVREQIYGMGRPRVARLSPSQVASRINGDRRHAHRAIESLIASGVLVREAEDTYRFIKDYTTWTKRGKPRLSADAIAFAQGSAPKKASPLSSRKMTNPTPSKTATTPSLSSHKMTAVISRDDKTGLAPNRNGRDEEFNNDDDERDSLRRTGTKTNTPDAKVDPRPNAVLPSRPDGVGAVHPDTAAAQAADELAAVIQATCPEIAAKLTPRLRSLTLAYPVDAIKQAIPEAFCRDLRGGPDAAVSYLLTTLRQWQADPTARTRPKPVQEVKPKTYAKPAPKKNPADYDPYAKPTPETLATLAKLRQMVYDARA